MHICEDPYQIFKINVVANHEILKPPQKKKSLHHEVLHRHTHTLTHAYTERERERGRESFP